MEKPRWVVITKKDYRRENSPEKIISENWRVPHEYSLPTDQHIKENSTQTGFRSEYLVFMQDFE